MKIVEGLKQTKILQKKVADLQAKVSKYCADMDHEDPTYDNQGEKIKEWMDSIRDTLKRVLELRIAIQKTNLVTNVGVELGGAVVTKTIAEWIHRRKDLATIECTSWKCLTNRNLKPIGFTATGKEEDARLAKPRIYFNVEERDKNVEVFMYEPEMINSTLEVVNATTDLIDVQ